MIWRSVKESTLKGKCNGLDRLMKTKTSKKRTMSLFNQGIKPLRRDPDDGRRSARPLMVAYDVEAKKHAIFRTVFGVV